MRKFRRKNRIDLLGVLPVRTTVGNYYPKKGKWIIGMGIGILLVLISFTIGNSPISFSNFLTKEEEIIMMILGIVIAVISYLCYLRLNNE